MRDDWEAKKLGEVCDTSAGGTPLKSHKDYYKNGTIPWLRSGEVGQSEILGSEKFITEKGLNNSSAKLFPPNSVLIAMYGATAGETGILRFEAATNQAVCAILPNDLFAPEYLYYFFLHYKQELISKAIGNAQPNLSQKKIKSTQIPIPPLPEQKRIVALLDEAFEALDGAMVNLERNIKNAEELFQSKLNIIFSERGEGWEEKPLKEACEVRPSKREVKEMLSGEDLVSFVPMSHLEINNKYFEEEDIKPLNDVYKGYTYFQNGDVLLAKITPCFENGKLGIASNLENEIGFGSTEYVVYRPNEDLSNEFLYYFLNRDSFRRIGESLMGGAVGHQRIQKEFYEDFLISYPSADKQKELVEEMDNIAELKSELITLLNTKIQSLEELKKSILQQAFSGQLTGESGLAGLEDHQDEWTNRAAEPEKEYKT